MGGDAMSGQRRANWEAKLDAVIDAHRDVVAQMLEAEALTRRNEVLALRERLEWEFNLKLAGLALAILVASTVIQAVSR